MKKETLEQVFSCEFCEISKNNVSTEHLWVTGSVFASFNGIQYCLSYLYSFCFILFNFIIYLFVLLLYVIYVFFIFIYIFIYFINLFVYFFDKIYINNSCKNIKKKIYVFMWFMLCIC